MINNITIARLLNLDDWKFLLDDFEEELEHIVYRDDFIPFLDSWRIVLKRWDLYKENRGLYNTKVFNNIEKRVEVLDYLVDIKISIFTKLLGVKL